MGEHSARDARSVGNDQGKPDAKTRGANPESGSEFAEQQRPHFTTSVDQRELDSDLPEQTQGMALKDDAAPGADAQGG